MTRVVMKPEYAIAPERGHPAFVNCGARACSHWLCWHVRRSVARAHPARSWSSWAVRHRLGAHEKLAGGVSEGLRKTVLAHEESDEGCFVVNMRDIEWIRGNVWTELIAGEERVA